MAQQGRKQRLECTVAAVQQRWGVRALHRAADAPAPTLPVCPTGFAALDRALGIGGLPRGRFSELIGHGTAGQFSVAAGALAQAQRQGGQVAYVDVEATADVDALARCGVQWGALTILRPRGLEHALAMTGDLLRAGGVSAVVFDRIRDLYLLADGEAFRAFDRALRDWTPLIARSLCAVILLTETTSPGLYPAGLPLPYFAGVRLEFACRRWLVRRKQVVGYVAQATVLKNKLGPSGQSVALDIMIA